MVGNVYFGCLRDLSKAANVTRSATEAIMSVVETAPMDIKRQLWYLVAW